MTAAWTIVAYGLREGIRRRVFLVVLVLTVGFLILYAAGVGFAFRDTREFVGDSLIVDTDAFTGATVLGLAMFATLFLGSVVAVFLTLGVVRGDAESGLLQPIVVRPIGRATFVLSRFGGAALVAATYVLTVYGMAVLITGTVGGWWPDHIVTPGLGLAGGVIILAGLSVLGSVFLSSTAQGIAVLMVFGAGLTAGLLGQIGETLGSETLRSIARVASWAVPFEALYQAGLHSLISDTSGLTGVVLSLGPFGGPAGAGVLLIPWALLYLGLVLGAMVAAFARRDL